MKVELFNVKRIFNSKTVLDIEKLKLDKGKVYAVLGPNGSGKTTMLRVLAGFDRDYSGSIHYNDRIKNQNNNITYMPQNVYMFDLTVLQNVILGLRSNGIKSSEVRRRAEYALDCVGMRGFSSAKARSLSGGEAQRVALARTLALRKSLVLLDEPASATDIAGQELVENYIKNININDGSTVVFTTHNPSQASRIADEVIIIHRGRVIEKGTPSIVFNSPEKQETKDFLQSWRI